MTQTIHVMLIEDNPEYSDVVALALEGESDVEMVGRFGTSEVALKSLDDQSKLPDVILLDLRLPGMSGLDSIPLLANVAPKAKIVVLTQSDEEADVLRAISLGAAGYLLKSATAKQLIDGIRTVAGGGGAPIDPSVASFILQTLQAQMPTPAGEKLLSEREQEILALLANGLVKKEIAKRLGISYTTVDTYVGRIYNKLKVNNAPAAVNEGHRRSILSKTKDAPPSS